MIVKLPGLPVLNCPAEGLGAAVSCSTWEPSEDASCHVMEVPLTVPVKVKEVKHVEPVAVAVPVTGADVPPAYAPCVAVPAMLNVFPLFDCSDP